MENRDRDKVNKNTSSTSGDSINRKTPSSQGKGSSDSKSDFGRKTGQSEEWKDEPSRRSGSGSSSSDSSSSDSSSRDKGGLSSSGGRGSSGSQE